jgi:hypothetical protein
MSIPPKTAPRVSPHVLLLLQVLLVAIWSVGSTTGKATTTMSNFRRRRRRHDPTRSRLLFDKASCDPGPHPIHLIIEETENTNTNSTATNSTRMVRQQAPDLFHVRWKTTADDADVVVQIHRDWAPIGADQFYNLILDNYFNCAAFYRVAPGA